VSDNRPLAKRVAEVQGRFAKETNDSQILLRELVPILERERRAAESAGPKGRRRFKVTRTSLMQRASRSAPNLAAMYAKYAESGLYEAFLAHNVSRFEAFLSSVVRMILIEYPHRLSASVGDIVAVKSVPLQLLLDSPSRDDAICRLADSHLFGVFLAGPREYMSYVCDLTGCQASPALIDKYCEVKATRDVVVHNGGIVNQVYVKKAGKLARALVGESLVVDSEYFEASLATLNQISQLVRKGVVATFARRRKAGRLAFA